ncbi:MAG: hypothetical protein HOP18_03920 [Deltaproteobacteria bacterium]|nr:hypothetical protein [Deltaproteobacteria bacterium]
MKSRELRFVFIFSSAAAVLFTFLLGAPYWALSQTPPAGSTPQKPPTTQTPPPGTAATGQAQTQKGSVSPSELDQRLQTLTRSLEGTEKKIAEFSKLIAQERSRLPSESVLLDQYLFLQSQVQELGAKVEQLRNQPGATPQQVTPNAAAPEAGGKNSLPLFSAVFLPILIVLLYDRLFNARRFSPLEERIEQVEDYAYGKDTGEGDPSKETKKEEG